MIKIHKWTCKECDDKLFLRVNDELPKDVIRLGVFEEYVSKHVILKGHEMTHKEKEDGTKIKYV